MKISINFFALFLITTGQFLSHAETSADPPASSIGSATAQKPVGVVGQWITIDDHSGKANGVVEINSVGQGLLGRIVELIHPERPITTCEKCTGALKNQPLVGLPILQGFQSIDGGRAWSGGTIIDPKSGKIYKCSLRLIDEGQKLEVRGYIGLSLFGRSQTWVRKVAPAATNSEVTPAPR